MATAQGCITPPVISTTRRSCTAPPTGSSWLRTSWRRRKSQNITSPSIAGEVQDRIKEGPYLQYGPSLFAAKSECEVASIAANRRRAPCCSEQIREQHVEACRQADRGRIRRASARSGNPVGCSDVLCWNR